MSDNKNNTVRNLLIGIALLSGISLTAKKFDLIGFQGSESNSTTTQINPNVISSRMTYGRFFRIPRNGMD